MLSKGKTAKAWEVLFERHKILENVRKNGFFEIKAKDIRKEREPRLMAKFDHYSNLPRIFKDNGLSILPISRSSYIIGQFEAYQSVSYNKNVRPKKVYLPSYITTIDPANLYSESSALHCSYITGMVDQVIGEQTFQTISGRMSSKVFDFNIRTMKGNSRRIQIKNSQIEIDGGYEGRNQFMIVEAKNETVDDFLVRQLYYPYRLWREKTYKPVIPVFFTYSNDVFSFFIYEFTDPMRYNSLKLIEQKNFIIAHEEIDFKDIIEVFQTVQVVPEPQVPFPQADSFIRIIDLLGLLVDNDMSKEHITSNYNFDERQTNYYTSAGRYLGLIEKYSNENGQVMYTLTEEGRNVMRMGTKVKFLELVKRVLSHQPFHKVFSEYLQFGIIPDRDKVIQIMKGSNLYKVNSESTYRRRASTIISWINWMIDLPNKY